REPDTGLAVAVAVVEHPAPAFVIEHAWVFDGCRLPAVPLRNQSSLNVLAVPGQAVIRLGVADPVRIPATREPHPVAVRVADHARPRDRVLVRRFEVDADAASWMPCDAVSRFGVDDAVLGSRFVRRRSPPHT